MRRQRSELRAPGSACDSDTLHAEHCLTAARPLDPDYRPGMVTREPPSSLLGTGGRMCGRSVPLRPQQHANPSRRTTMSIFSKLKEKIFGKKDVAPAPAPTPFPGTGAPPAAPAVAPMREVDVEASLEAMAAASSQNSTGEPRSSTYEARRDGERLAERRELAAELGYSGDTDDTQR